MKEIPVRNKTGIIGYTLIDDEDFERVSKKHRWHLTRKGYVQTSHPIKTYLHRLIMNAPKGVQVDHIHNNKMDNRKSELRFATNGQNKCNGRKYKSGNTSKYKGVHWDKRDKIWMAQIQSDNRQIHIGSFRSEIAAAKAYNEAAKKHHREFALLNVIPETVNDWFSE